MHYALCIMYLNICGVIGRLAVKKPPFPFLLTQELKNPKNYSLIMERERQTVECSPGPSGFCGCASKWPAR